MVDLGQHAGETTGACFWLSLAAGLSQGSWQIDSQALPGLADATALLEQLRAMPKQNLHKLDNKGKEHIQSTELGRFAERLRHFMCAGPDAVLLRRDMKEVLYAVESG